MRGRSLAILSSAGTRTSLQGGRGGSRRNSSGQRSRARMVAPMSSTSGSSGLTSPASPGPVAVTVFEPGEHPITPLSEPKRHNQAGELCLGGRGARASSTMRFCDRQDDAGRGSFDTSGTNPVGWCDDALTLGERLRAPTSHSFWRSNQFDPSGFRNSRGTQRLRSLRSLSSVIQPRAPHARRWPRRALRSQLGRPKQDGQYSMSDSVRIPSVATPGRKSGSRSGISVG